jgi:DNA-binding MarR family transcriptional regulator
MPDAPSTVPRHAAGKRAVTRIETACRQAVAGKLAVRRLARWVEGFGVSEIEFRFLWLLFLEAESDAQRLEVLFDQAALAECLAVSPARVSAAVERLRAAGLVERAAARGDRRRQCWRLAERGRALVSSVIAAVEALPPDNPQLDGNKEAA